MTNTSLLALRSLVSMILPHTATWLLYGDQVTHAGPHAMAGCSMTFMCATVPTQVTT